MDKKVVLVFCLILFCISFVSASWFSGFFKKVTENTPENPISGNIIGNKVNDNTLNLDAQDFDVKCDGVTDDTEAIQNVMTLAADLNRQPIFPQGICIISSTIELNTGFSGSGNVWDSTYGTVFKWVGDEKVVFEFGDYTCGWVFENFLIDLSNVETDVVAMKFTKGLTVGTFRDITIRGYYTPLGSLLKGEYKNHDGFYFVGGSSLIPRKYDVSINTFDKVFFERLRYGLTMTDPSKQGSGGENTFRDCFAAVDGYAFQVTGRSNLWIGGDFSASEGNTIWKLIGPFTTGTTIIGVNAEMSSPSDSAITLDPTTAESGNGAMATIIGGKVFTGSWVNDLGQESNLIRWIRLGDEDSISGIQARFAAVSTQPYLSNLITNMGGIIGQGNGKILQLRGSSGTAGMVLLGNILSDGTNEVTVNGVSIVSGQGGSINFGRTEDGERVIKIGSINNSGLEIIGNIHASGTICNGDGICIEDGKENSKWKSSGKNIYYDEGRIGIGDSTPDAMLDIDGGAFFAGDKLYIGGHNGHPVIVGWNGQDLRFATNGQYNNPSMIIDVNGNVKINSVAGKDNFNENSIVCVKGNGALGVCSNTPTISKCNCI